MRFQNPANNYTEESPAPWLWTLLFGGLYFASKGVWTHAVVSFVLALVTVGLSWVIYPFFARDIVRSAYLRKGWLEVS